MYGLMCVFASSRVWECKVREGVSVCGVCLFQCDMRARVSRARVLAVTRWLTEHEPAAVSGLRGVST